MARLLKSPGQKLINMQNPRLAFRYAKSLVDLALEKGQLELVYNDMMLLHGICKSSRDFVNMLKSPVISADKKVKIFTAILEGKVNSFTLLFGRLLIEKRREGFLPEIIRAFIEQYRTVKGIHKVKITTATPLSATLENEIRQKVQNSLALQNVELEMAVNEDLIGGFVLETEDKLFDASIRRDLKDIKKQFMENVYIQRIR